MIFERGNSTHNVCCGFIKSYYYKIISRVPFASNLWNRVSKQWRMYYNNSNDKDEFLFYVFPNCKTKMWMFEFRYFILSNCYNYITFLDIFKLQYHLEFSLIHIMLTVQIDFKWILKQTLPRSFMNVFQSIAWIWTKMSQNCLRTLRMNAYFPTELQLYDNECALVILWRKHANTLVDVFDQPIIK